MLSLNFWQCYFVANNIHYWGLFMLEFNPSPEILFKPHVPPTFQVLDEYCKDTQFSTELSLLTWLKNVLSVDYGYRILLFGLYGFMFKFVEKSVMNRNNYLRILCLNFFIIFILTAIDHYISRKYLGNDVFDDIYNNNSIYIRGGDEILK